MFLFEYATVAKTVAKDFESNCVCEDKAVFKMVAEEGFEPPTFGLWVIVEYLVLSWVYLY